MTQKEKERSFFTGSELFASFSSDGLPQAGGDVTCYSLRYGNGYSKKYAFSFRDGWSANTGNTCGKPELFHNLHRLIHRGFPQLEFRGMQKTVYIIKNDRFRQSPHFFAPIITTNCEVTLWKKTLDKGSGKGLAGGVQDF